MELLNKEDKVLYKFDEYVNKQRWMSYYYQISEVLKCNPDNVLLIGCGDNIVTQCLKQKGIHVCTFDIDERLKPDYIGDLINISNIVGPKRFDCILCCQVLEHLEYSLLDDILKQLKEISNNLIVSLPIRAFKGAIAIKIPLVRELRFCICIPLFWERFKFNGEHYWEIGCKDTPLKIIKQVISKYYVIEKDYLCKENMYHWFFILKIK